MLSKSFKGSGRSSGVHATLRMSFDWKRVKDVKGLCFFGGMSDIFLEDFDTFGEALVNKQSPELALDAAWTLNEMAGCRFLC